MQELDLSACTAISEENLPIIASLSYLTCLRASKLAHPQGLPVTGMFLCMAPLLNNLSGKLALPSLSTCSCMISPAEPVLLQGFALWSSQTA